MPTGQSDAEQHEQLCGRKNVGTALCFAGASLLMLYVSWRDVGKPYAPLSFYFVAWELIVIAICFRSMMIFDCFQERLILGIAMAVPIRGLLSKLSPGLIANLTPLLRHAFLLLWAVALLASLTMLVSSISMPESA